jgi:hypothetical protein
VETGEKVSQKLVNIYNTKVYQLQEKKVIFIVTDVTTSSIAYLSVLLILEAISWKNNYT